MQITDKAREAGSLDIRSLPLVSNDNSPAVIWAGRIADAYAASVKARPLDQAALGLLRRDLAQQIDVGLTFGGSIWLLHANRVLDVWDRERGVSEDTLRIIEAEGVFTMKPRSRVMSD